MISIQELEEFIRKAQLEILPRYAPKEHGPVLVVTVEGLRNFINQHEH